MVIMDGFYYMSLVTTFLWTLMISFTLSNNWGLLQVVPLTTSSAGDMVVSWWSYITNNVSPGLV
jgi:hypothetical protein